MVCTVMQVVCSRAARQTHDGPTVAGQRTASTQSRSCWLLSPWMASAGHPSVRSCRVTASHPRLVSQKTCAAVLPEHLHVPQHGSQALRADQIFRLLRTPLLRCVKITWAKHLGGACEGAHQDAGAVHLALQQAAEHAHLVVVRQELELLLYHVVGLRMHMPAPQGKLCS